MAASITKSARETPLGASPKNARETVTVVRHGKWAVDVVSRGSAKSS
jgi:hypothetical protein